MNYSQYLRHDGADDDENQAGARKAPELMPTPANGNAFPSDRSNGNLTTFPAIRSPSDREEADIPEGVRGWIPMAKLQARKVFTATTHGISQASQSVFHSLPNGLQTVFAKIYGFVERVFAAFWNVMNPPLWAMLVAVIVATIPALQRLFFTPGTFINSSVTRAVTQSGGVAVPLILVVLGANLARNTLPKEALDKNSEENKIGNKLLIASLISRMLLPTIIMAPMLALAAKFVPVSILDDPIFVVVCFLLTGAPSALQLAQICQINGVYEGVMSKLLFQSYVIWYVMPTILKEYRVLI